MSLEGEVRFNVFFRLGKRGFKKMIEVQSNTNEDFEVLQTRVKRTGETDQEVKEKMHMPEPFEMKMSTSGRNTLDSMQILTPANIKTLVFIYLFIYLFHFIYSFSFFLD